MAPGILHVQVEGWGRPGEVRRREKFGPSALPAAVAKPVPKTAPKPPPKKSPPPHQYPSHTTFRYVLRYFGVELATERGSKEINVCPGLGWMELVAARGEPTHLHPRDLLDHRDHGSDPAQRDQAMAMLAGIMPGGQAGPFASAQARSRTLALPTGARPAGGQGASHLQHRVGRAGLRRRLLRGARGQVRRAVEPRDRPLCLLDRDRRRPPEMVTGRGRGCLTSRPLRVWVVPLRPMTRDRRGPSSGGAAG